MIARWDRAVVEALQHLHWGPADWCFEQLSEWWARSLVIIGVGLVADLMSRRRLPVAALSGTLCFLAADGIVLRLKDVFDRPRPSAVDPAVHPLVAVPHSFSMPSSHAATAFAAALAVGLVHSRLRWPLLVLAALVSLSRVWLGVHYPSDVLAGAAIGAAVAYAAWPLVSRAGGRASRGRARIGASATAGRRARAAPGRRARRARRRPRA